MAELLKVDLVGVGLNATDLIIPVVEYPKRGSKTEYKGGSMLPGGQVATTVIACQQWGLQTRYVGKLGQDGSAALHYEAFAKAGVETQITTVPGGMSAQSTILVDEGGERTVLCRRDERLMLRPEDLKREWVEQARALHLDGYETEAATLAAGWARAAGVPVVGDLDEIYPGVHELLRRIDYLIVSQDFPCRLMGEPDVSVALRAMHKEYGCRLSAATLGEHGVIAWNGREYRTAAAYRVPVVDTTGAGDIFRAGFIFGLLQGWPLDRQMDFACAAAAMNCTGLGARGRIETVGAIEELMATGESIRDGGDGIFEQWINGLTAVCRDGRVYGEVTAYFARFSILRRGCAMSFGKGAKAVLTDSHFLVPFCVLVAGILLLVVLH